MTSPDVAAPRLPWDPADPFPFYESRRTGDVVWDDAAGAWLVLGYDAAREVLGGHGWTSDPLAFWDNGFPVDPISRDFIGSSMLFADGATHQRLRSSVRDVFTRSFIANLTLGVESVVAAVTGHPPTGTPFDFMSEIAMPIPLAVVAEWLNLDPDSADLLREQSPVVIRMLGALADEAELQAGSAAAAELVAQFLPLAADRRANPGDDLLSFIAADPAIELDEVVMTSILIAVAGHETTANLLGAGLFRLLVADPDGVRLADRVDPADPATITELLRLDAPAQAAVRTATLDHSVGGVDIAAGQRVLIVVAAANRDPAVFEDPSTFRIDRTGAAPLSFGYGAHYCLGAALARLEIASALPRILDRRPRLVAAPTWRDTPAIRGPLRLPVTFADGEP